MSSELKPYARYKDSGVEWLGEVPEHWAVKRLKYSCRMTGGGTPDTTNDKYWGGTIPWVSSREMKIGVIGKTEQSITQEGLRASAAALIEPGSMLIVMRSGILKHTLPVAINRSPITINQDLRALRFGESVSARYVVRLFEGKNRELLSFLRKQGATVESIDSQRLDNCPISLPPLPEQRAIADYLDTETGRIDALISEQRELIELLKEKRQALISHCVTRGLDPDVPMKDSGVEWLGEVPEHWEVKRLKYAISFIEGPGILAKDFREEGVPLIRISGAQSRFVALDGCNYLDPEDVESRWEHFRMEVGDLLISASASTGTVAEVDKRTAGAIPYTGLIRLRPHASQTVKDFVRYMVSSDVFYVQIRHHQTGSTIQHFGPTHLARMVIPLPPLPEQHAIADYLDTETGRIDALIKEAEETISLMQERRSALISACVTGKVKVPGVADPASQEQAV